MMTKVTSRLTFGLLLCLILLTAGWVRLYNLNWDLGTHLHPDERYLTMVAGGVRLPASLDEYWDTALSPMNPANQQQSGYVYGTLPLFVTRLAGEWLDQACGQSPTPAATAFRALLFDAQMPCWEGTYTGYNGIHLVGRYLSTLADLFTLMGLVFLARRLYDDRIALLSGALYAFAALPIQHAHFFVVDSFATVFVVWTLYWVADAVASDRPISLALAGAFTGLAVASKISAWPLAGIVALGSIVRRTDPDSSEYDFALRTPQLIAVVISGMLAALAFRVMQPYAFSGPGFFDVRFNPQWVETMKGAREMASGLRDVPFGHQWADRTPIIFPWINMVFWGMGLPLGLAAWIGWGAISWRLLRHYRLRHLIPWVWGTFFFLYQATQWVKSMRYLLPIYPVFAMFAAWLVWRGWDWIVTRDRWRAALRIVWIVASVGVLAGAAAWASAFLQLYARTFSRVAASEWMFEHIPTAITLSGSAGETQVPLLPGVVLSQQVNAPVTTFTTQAALLVEQIRLNRVNGFGTAGPRTVQVRLAADASGLALLGSATLTADIPADGKIALTLPLAPVMLDAGQVVYVWVQLLDGAPLQLQSSVLANEHWDDVLPVRMADKDPYHNWYSGLTSSPTGVMNLYDEDTADKRTSLLNWLDEADYIVLTSNRLYGSIPRLPMRYPMSVAYYQALFDGSLGFELQAKFVSFPSIGPCQFPDQETPFPMPKARYSTDLPCSIPYPPAEEAYSVYDHPQVLIFAKTAAYSRETAATILDPRLLDHVQWMTPRDATRNKNRSAAPGDGGSSTDGGGLLLSSQAQMVQQSGGTWSELFNRNALQNQVQVVAVILWWLMLVALGWMAFPWLYHALPALRDRGYALAKAAGLLFWAYPAWLLASLHWAPHTRWLLWGVFVVLSAASAALAYFRRTELWDFVRANRRMLVRSEMLFAALYLVWVGVRFLNPDLWHPVVGGEKPMDFAYLNAIIKSTWFPPYDPWFSGGAMNYYYFGFVMFGSLMKALGIMPSIGYNLAIPAIFALTGVGAYTLASNLAGGDARRGHRAGLWGLALVLLLGNFGEVRLLFKGFQEIGGITFESLIPGYPALVSALVGVWKVIAQGTPLQFRPEWWYWDATRVIPFAPGEVGAINEFPLFTFLYGDLHAHMMAFPFTQLALAVALQWGLTTLDLRRPWNALRPYSTLALGALVAGCLRATNTWDYPTYVGIMSVAVILNVLHRWLTGSPDGRWLPENTFLLARLLLPVALVVLAEWFFKPYTDHYVIAYKSFDMWQGSRTPLGIFFVMYGQFLIPLICMGAWKGYHAVKSLWERYAQTLMLVGMGLLLLLVLFVALGAPVAWVVILLGGLAALLVVNPDSTPQARLLWFWVGTALTLSLLVEIIVLQGDIGRMNTVFKFYLQVWMLLGLAAAVAVERLIAVWDENTLLPQRLGDAVMVTLSILFCGVILYPLLALPARVRDRWTMAAPHSLDGMAFMPYVVQYEHGATIPLRDDYTLIQWLQDNVAGSPVIIEGQGEREYLWGGRISIYTGLPAVAAWRWHQVQQRLVMPSGTVEMRQYKVRGFYLTPVMEHALNTLKEFGIRYIIVGAYERAYGIPEGWPKFETLVQQGYLDVAYQNGETVVYHVLRYE